jgi:membrane associated rhomboid family serine protease/Zn-finger nucleic acid-binding protein
MFTCPNCGSTLTRTPGPKGLFWNCDNCGGRAVGIPVLRTVIGNNRVTALWSRVIDNDSHTGRACPICSRNMTVVTMGVAGQALELGVCTRCEFVWFDPAEYESIPPAPPKSKELGIVDEGDLPQPAREALAIYKVQQMAEQARKEEGPLSDIDVNWKTVPGVLGLPVEENPAPFTRVPWLTFSLALVIAAISIWAFSDLPAAVRRFGLIPAEALRYGGLTLLTSFFIHAGIWHLVSNLYFLIIFGDRVEDYLGRWRWLLLVILASLAGDLTHIMINPHDPTPCIGASGGISGLIAFYALKFPHAKLEVFMRFGFIIIPKWVSIPAWSLFLVWFFLQGWGVHEQFAGFNRISSAAHVGGAITGILLWLVWRKIELQPVDNPPENTVELTA